MVTTIVFMLFPFPTLTTFSTSPTSHKSLVRSLWVCGVLCRALQGIRNKPRMLDTPHQVGKMRQARVHTLPYTHFFGGSSGQSSSFSSLELYLVLDGFWCFVRLGKQRMTLTHMDAVLQGNNIKVAWPTASTTLMISYALPHATPCDQCFMFTLI